jgi:hypothetical protein
MNFEWLDNVEKLSDERIVKYIKGLQRGLEDEDNPQTRALLRERLGVLLIEAEKRGLTLENA